ncbi:hypothetical protein [Actinocorallia longicatena]|uniref:DUF3618 domain-containing protein n=1 Tax=Actinocorallia longicatena TaxID=111803 RepID=A0ABP6Q6G2_9ACTN
MSNDHGPSGRPPGAGTTPTGTTTDWRPGPSPAVDEPVASGDPSDAKEARDFADEHLGTAKDKAAEAKAKAVEAKDKAVEVARKPGNGAKIGGAAAAGLAVLLWMRRRRRNRRPSTRWEKTKSVSAQTASIVRDQTAALLASDAAARAKDGARNVAANPDSRPRAQGMAATIGTMVVMQILRRAARRTPK